MEKSDHDMITEIHATIFGTNGQGGCYRTHTKAINDFCKFKRNCLIVCAFLLGTGVLGIGAIEVIKLVRG